jgi:hypothetical protein
MWKNSIYRGEVQGTEMCLLQSKRTGTGPVLFEELSYEKLKKGNYVNQITICCLQKLLYNEIMT